MKRNIDKKGRVARAISGACCMLAGTVMIVAAWPNQPTWRWSIAGLLIVAGLFQFFEAKKAWCVARACGIRTPM